MKFIHQNKSLYDRRKELRNNVTPQENLLWQYLRKSKLGFKFSRQHSIGPYIVDFYCPSKRIIIELDGQQHLDNKEYDNTRDEYLTHLNHIILRFWNSEIETDLAGVLNKIKSIL